MRTINPLTGTLLLAFTMILGLAPSQVSATKAAVSNRAPSEDEIGYLPASGTTVGINPPPIAWLDDKLATSWTLQISPTEDFTSPVVTVADWPWLMYTHNEPLTPGRYYWRYSFITDDQARSDWSRVREFTIGADVPNFPRPSADKLRSIVPSVHPRMFTTPDKLEALQKTATPDNLHLKSLLKAADSYLTSTIMAEPKPWSTGKWDAGEWGEYLRQASAATARLDTLAFAWLLTGEDNYGSRAREALMAYSTWDPHGPSSMKINDEVGMPMLHSISRAYDWIHPLLSEEDKAVVRKHIRGRGEETYDYMRKKPYEQFVYNSHFGRMFHFLGEAGLAFYGEIPEAEKWLNYSMTIFYGWYPFWGREDGGWAEGLAYWSSYNTRVTWWLDLMKESLGIDGSEKPFYARVANFPLYVSPPGNPVSGFGDFSERPASPEGVGKTVAAYALFRQNGLWQWYADKLGADHGTDPFGYMRSLRKQPQPVAPVGLPMLKLFDKVGYALFHTDLANPEKNLHVAMRCSPLGNVSHSHNDQNAIVMSAFGEPLLVNTGTRDFYGSPFCKEYYWHTQSHNAILFNGQGQKRDKNTTGTFVAHGEQPGKVAWVVGDATRAYPDFVSHYRRWLIFLPDTGAVMIDEFKTTASTASLLFHARSPFEWDEDRASFEMTKGKVTLEGQMHLWSTIEKVDFVQTDHYPITLGNNKAPLFDEWHLKAHVPLSKEAAEKQFIVTWLEAKKDSSDDSFNMHKMFLWNDKLTLSQKDGERDTSIELEIDLSKLTVNRTK